MHEKKWLHKALSICLLMVIIVGILLPGCKAEESQVEFNYTVGVTSFPRSKNPFSSVTSGADIDALSQVYEPLLVHTENFGTAIPMLAKSWEYDVANNIWTFHLDEKAKFSDGIAVTAKDVKYSWETALNVAKQFPTALAMVKSISTPDDKTVKIALTNTYADFLNVVGNFLIVPEHVWSKVGDVLTYLNQEPVGSGAYFWTEYMTDSHAKFTRNPDYWRGAGTITNVILKYYGDANSMLMAYRKGDIDAMESMTLRSAVPALLMDPNIKILFSTADNTWIMMLNLRREPFNILEFRQAIDIVLNRQLMIDTVLNGYGIIPQQVPIGPGTADYVPELKWPYVFKIQTERIAMANAKLDAIPGMSAKGTDGIRSYNGNKLIFNNFYHSTYAETASQSALIKGDLLSIGIQFNSKALPYTQCFAKVHTHAGTDPLGWDAFYSPSSPSTFWTNWAQPAPAPLAQGGIWGSRLYQSEAAGYTNTTIQTKLKQEAIEMDPQKRSVLHMEIEKLLAADLPLIVLYHNINIATYRTDRFKGWIVGTDKYTGEGIAYGQVNSAFVLTPLNTLSLKPITE